MPTECVVRCCSIVIMLGLGIWGTIILAYLTSDDAVLTVLGIVVLIGIVLIVCSGCGGCGPVSPGTTSCGTTAVTQTCSLSSPFVHSVQSVREHPLGPVEP